MRPVHFSIVLGVVCLAFIFTGCQKELWLDATTGTQAAFVTEFEPCGEVLTEDLTNDTDCLTGSLSVANDEEELEITFEAPVAWLISQSSAFIGHCDSIPVDSLDNPDVSQFPYQTEHDPAESEFTYTIDLEELYASCPDDGESDSCYCVLAWAEVVLLDDEGMIAEVDTLWANDGDVLEYCIQDCDEEEEEEEDDCDGFRTQTQGGWGSPPNGNNPGMFLHDHFEEAFPDSLVIGCDSNTLVLTNAQAITDLLPEGGTPAILTESYVDPESVGSVLVGQIVALSLSVGFDDAIDDFGESDDSLSDLVVSEGTFEGWTVGEVLEEANLVLGGCSEDYTPQEINSVLSSINESFVDGEGSSGFLDCP